MHNFWLKMTKTTIPHSYNSQTFEQFNGGRTVSTWKWGHEKKLFFDLFFFYVFHFFHLPISFFGHNFLLFRTAANSRSNIFLHFSNFFMVFQKNGKQGAKNDIFLF